MTSSENEIYYMDYSARRGYNGYNHGSSAYDIDFDRRVREEQRKNIEAERRRKQAVRERTERRENAFHLLRLAFAAGVFFFGCVLTITAVSSVSEMRFQIKELKEELSVLQNENIVLSSEISDTINLDYIEDRAVNELGMSEPQSYQIKTINVPEQSYTLQYSDKGSNAPEVNGELLKEFFLNG